MVVLVVYNKAKYSPEGRRKSYLKHRDKTTKAQRVYSLKRKFNLSIEDYNKMLEEQNHTCAICQKPEIVIDKRAGKLRELAVDHCHTTGKIRGLLCYNCNRGIGHLQDSVELLQRACSYLRKTKEIYNGT